MQTRLIPLQIERERSDYPRVNYVDDKEIQWIELNRGCKRQCPFCYADPNYKMFDVPEIKTNKVMIIGENILYDPQIKDKLIQLSNTKVNNKVVYYGLCNGVDYRLLDDNIINILSFGRFGRISNKGNWKKGLSIAWDWDKDQEDGVYNALEALIDAGYKREQMQVYVLVNWAITPRVCNYKLKKIMEWKVQVCDCPKDCTKKNFIPLDWTYKEYKIFREKCRDWNIRVQRMGFNPEKDNTGLNTPKSQLTLAL